MQNKVVVITGASQGIGLALSEIFSEAGYFVGRISRNIEQNQGHNPAFFRGWSSPSKH